MIKRLNNVNVLSQWRHTHGFGVHSPFAFRFLADIVRLPQLYYADHVLQNREVRIIHRIVARLSPEKIFATPDIPEEVVKGIRLADSRVQIDGDVPTGESGIFAFIGSKVDTEVINTLSAADNNIIYFADLQGVDLNHLSVGRSSGVLFYSRRKAILFTRSEMQFVAYDIFL